MLRSSTVLRAFAGLLTACAAGASSTASAKAADETERPNIVVIVLDDVGYADLGAFGSEIRTPSIDALAEAGLRYNYFESKAICSATRASLLTGRNNHTIRMADLASWRPSPDPSDDSATKGEMQLNVEMLPTVLRNVGYTTTALGKWHISPAYDELPEQGQRSWPLQRGFDYYYGFISGWTDQYEPDLVENNQHIATPTEDGYHFSEDLVDRAIERWREQNEAHPDKPHFLYLAFGAAHSPIQVPEPYADAYEGVYDRGWDAIRSERLEKQKRIGLVPEDTVLPPRNPGDRPWSDLGEDRQRVFARFMEVYAGFITHTDEQIGRLVSYIDETGEFDNTLFVLISDNGAASEGGQDGNFWDHYADRDTSIDEMQKNLGLIGGPETHSLYQRPWAMAGVTPFRRYKLWPYSGGVRTPMIIAWPDRIEDAGAIRTQPVDVIDLAPTVAAAAGTSFRDAIDDVRQIPVAGQSIANTWDSPTASTRPVQFFSLRGNRAIRSGPWRAVAMHALNTDFSEDQWQLFNLQEDFAGAHDLAKEYPEKLQELKKLWWDEARKYSSQPLVEDMPILYEMNGISDAFAEPQ